MRKQLLRKLRGDAGDGPQAFAAKRDGGERAMVATSGTDRLYQEELSALCREMFLSGQPWMWRCAAHRRDDLGGASTVQSHFPCLSCLEALVSLGACYACSCQRVDDPLADQPSALLATVPEEIRPPRTIVGPQ